MATSLNALVLKINADTSGVSAGVRAVRSDVSKINRIMRQTATETDKASDATSALARIMRTGALTQDEYARALGAINKKYDANAERMARAKSLVASHTPQVDRLERQMSELKQEFKAGNIAATDFYRTMRALTEQHTKLRAKTIQAKLSQRELNEEIYAGMRGRPVEGIKQQTSAIGFLTRRLIPLAIGYKLVGQASQGMRDQFELDQAQRQVEVFTKSATQARSLTKEMEQLAAQTPLTFGAIGQASQRLLAAKVESSELMDRLKRLGDVAQGNDEVFGRLALAYSQVLSKGRLMGQEANQMAEAGFPLLAMMAEQTGQSVAELMKRMEQGGISAAEVTRQIKLATEATGLYANSMDKFAESNEGKLKQMANSFSILRRNISSIVTGPLAEFSTLFKSSFDWMNRVFDRVRQNIAFVRGERIDQQAEQVAKLAEATEKLNNAAGTTDPEAEKKEARWQVANRAVFELIEALDKENQQIMLGNREYERRQFLYAGATESQLKFLEAAQNENDKLKERKRLLDEQKRMKDAEVADLKRQAEDLQQTLQSPWQAMVEEMRRLNRLRQEGVISESTFDKAKNNAASKFANQQRPVQVELPPSVTRGSREEYQLISGQQQKAREAAQKRHLEQVALFTAQKIAAEKAATNSDAIKESAERTATSLEGLDFAESV